MSITSHEQLAIELINRARLDPEGEPGRLGITDPAEIAGMDLPGAGMSPLAQIAELSDAAADHSEWMLDTDTFSHTGAGGSSAGDRMEDAGYVFTGNWRWGENIGYQSTSGTVNVTASVGVLHSGLFKSDGHRANILNAEFRELGIGIELGDFNGYNAVMETQNFATTGGRTFLTGVAYDDSDGDDFYSVGEGVSGVTFAFNDASGRTAAAGGYAVESAPFGNRVVTVTSGSDTYRVKVQFSGDNVKLDLVNGDTLLSSADMELLGTEALNGGLLGVADLNLEGNDGANVLTGNSGDNDLTGAGGDDSVDGGAGTDTVYLSVDIADARIEVGAAGVRIVSAEGDDYYTNVEFFAFADVVVALEDLAQYVPPEAPEAPADPAPDLPPAAPVNPLEQVGTAEADGLKGTSQGDVLRGLGGDDRLPGGDGDDRVYGGVGDDRLGGGNGNDLLEGGDGNDRGGGGPGNDTIYGGAGNDWFSGGPQSDYLSGGDGNDRLAGSFGVDTVLGGAGDDTMGGGAGGDLMDGGAGNDQIGAGFHDDTVHGGSGDDYLGAGDGDDLVFGDAGADTLNGGLGDDTLSGGAGADTFLFNALISDGQDVIRDFEVGVDTIRLVGLRKVNDFDRVDLHDTAAGASLSYGDHTILIEGVSVDDLGADDFLLS